jgi:hypothetical protein
MKGIRRPNKEVFMLLQGDLQAVFDALYSMGVIDPILEKDWKNFDELEHDTRRIEKVVQTVNSCSGDTDKIIGILKKFDTETLEYLAMEVAREFADFYARKDIH